MLDYLVTVGIDFERLATACKGMISLGMPVRRSARVQCLWVD